MSDYKRALGDTVRKTRTRLGLTQYEVAAKINIDSRTVMNIENYKGNPKMEVMYPLIRSLKIDPWDIFYPELQDRSTAFRQLQIMLSECGEEEIEALLPICRAVLSALKSKNVSPIE